MSEIDKKEIDEILKEDMPEAKSSVSYSLYSKDGFSVIFTVRSSNEAELLETMEDLEKSLIKRGYSPKFGSAKPVEFPSKEVKQEVKSDVCPKCDSPLVRFVSKDGTKSGMKCSTATYDWTTKTAGGCDYVKWDDTPIQGDKATPAQESLLKAKNLWEEGMTKSQASKVIQSVLGK
jgi:hypothetical protein